MTKRKRRKCLNCGQLFRSDPRNLRHQPVLRGAGLPEAKHGESRLHGWQQLLNERGQSRIVRAVRRPQKTTISNRWISFSFTPLVAVWALTPDNDSRPVGY